MSENLPDEVFEVDPVGEPEPTDNLAPAAEGGPEGDVEEAEF